VRSQVEERLRVKHEFKKSDDPNASIKHPSMQDLRRRIIARRNACNDAIACQPSAPIPLPPRNLDFETFSEENKPKEDAEADVHPDPEDPRTPPQSPAPDGSTEPDVF